MGKTNHEIYICDDNPIEESEMIKNMTDEEIETQFRRRFGDYIEKGEGKFPLHG